MNNGISWFSIRLKCRHQFYKKVDVTVGREIKTRTAEALKMAIKALEQEHILDKIRDEIEFEVDHRTNMLCAEDVFAIIDKYKAESEDKE